MNTKGMDGQKKGKKKNPHAVALVNIRWEKTTADELKTHVRKMVTGRLKAQAETKAARKKAAAKKKKAAAARKKAAKARVTVRS